MFSQKIWGGQKGGQFFFTKIKTENQLINKNAKF